MTYELTTWYLEMHSPRELQAARVPEPAPLILRAELPSPALSRFLYSAVGGDWHWRGRLSWSHSRWMEYLDRAEVQTWIAYVQGTPAGYVELEKQADDDVEIAYFGLLRAFIGRRLGGHLLSVGITRAWEMGARRVWVHTCTLDGAQALPNYQARGMKLYDTEITQIPDPGLAVGPWPGADAP